MTLGIVLTCEGGVVVGSDKKTVRDKGVNIQKQTSKITYFELSNKTPVFCCHAGAKTVAERVLGQIHPDEYSADKTSSFTNYMSNVVEEIIPKFARQYHSKHGDVPNLRIAMGTVQNDEPIASTVYPTGKFDYDETYTAIGSGSLLAEHFLRDPYVGECNIEDARKLVGYIIQRVSKVDSNVDGIEVMSINEEGVVEKLSEYYKLALQVEDVVGDQYRMEIENDIEHVEEFGAALEHSFENTESGDSEEGTEQD